MDKYANIKNYSEPKFKAVTGVTHATFNALLELLYAAYAVLHKRWGRHRKLSQENMLLMTLEYHKEYRTYECIGANYGLHKSNVGEVINQCTQMSFVNK